MVQQAASRLSAGGRSITWRRDGEAVMRVDGRVFSKGSRALSTALTSPRAPVFSSYARRASIQGLGLKFDIDAIGGKIQLFAQDDGIVGVFEDVAEIGFRQSFENGYARAVGRQTPIQNRS
jgi:hypothetical protein